MDIMKTKGRRVAIGEGAVAIVVLAVAVVVSRDRIREEWHLHVLRTGYAEERLAAAKRLGELRSVRAVPRLIERYESLQANEAVRLPTANDVFQEAMKEIGEPALPALVRALAVKLEGLPHDAGDFVFINEALERIYLKKTRPRK